MDTDKGWNLPAATTRKIKLLDYLFEHGRGSRFASAPGEAGVVGSDAHRNAMSDLQSFEALGWVALAGSADGNYTARLLPAGGEQVERIHHERADVAKRAKASRDALLYWVHARYLDGNEHPLISGFTDSPYGAYFGEPFTEQEVRRAGDWLKQEGYLAGVSSFQAGLVRPRLTSQGIKLVDSGRSVNDPAPLASVMSHVTTIHGDNNTVQTGSPGATQNVTLTLTEDRREQVLQLADLFEQAAASLPPEVVDAARALRGTVAPGQHDTGAVTKALDTLKSTVAAGTGAVLGNALLAGSVDLFTHFHVPH